MQDAIRKGKPIRNALAVIMLTTKLVMCSPKLVMCSPKLVMCLPKCSLVLQKCRQQQSLEGSGLRLL